MRNCYIKNLSGSKKKQLNEKLLHKKLKWFKEDFSGKFTREFKF